MKRISAVACSLMFVAMMFVVLVQSLALATLPVAPAEAVAVAVQPPCHQQGQPAQDNNHHAMPCCDGEGGCGPGDCSLNCYRAGAAYLGVPALLTASAPIPGQAPPNASASALTSRQPIPPLPPPIFA